MQLVTNEKLAKRRFRLGTAFHLAALAILMAGLFASLQLPEGGPDAEDYQTVRLLIPYAAILLFLVPYYFGKQYIQRYGPKNRHDAALASATKGLDNRYTLLSFPSGGLPDYLVIGPGGVYVLVPRAQSGVLVCRGDRWERHGVSGIAKLITTLWGTPIGNPARDVHDGMVRVARALRERLGEQADGIPVNGLVVFTHPDAKLQLTGCTSAATTARNLKNQLRGVKGGLPPAVLARVRDALTGESGR
jgi:hypothetical protein